MSANGDQEAKQAAACKALADSFDEDNEQAEDLILEQKVSSPPSFEAKS